MNKIVYSFPRVLAVFAFVTYGIIIFYGISMISCGSQSTCSTCSETHTVCDVTQAGYDAYLMSLPSFAATFDLVILQKDSKAIPNMKGRMVVDRLKNRLYLIIMDAALEVPLLQCVLANDHLSIVIHEADQSKRFIEGGYDLLDLSHVYPDLKINIQQLIQMVFGRVILEPIQSFEPLQPFAVVAHTEAHDYYMEWNSVGCQLKKVTQQDPSSQQIRFQLTYDAYQDLEFVDRCICIPFKQTLVDATENDRTVIMRLRDYYPVTKIDDDRYFQLSGVEN